MEERWELSHEGDEMGEVERDVSCPVPEEGRIRVIEKRTPSQVEERGSNEGDECTGSCRKEKVYSKAVQRKEDT